MRLEEQGISKMYQTLQGACYQQAYLSFQLIPRSWRIPPHPPPCSTLPWTTAGYAGRHRTFQSATLTVETVISWRSEYRLPLDLCPAVVTTVLLSVQI